VQVKFLDIQVFSFKGTENMYLKKLVIKISSSLLTFLAFSFFIINGAYAADFKMISKASELVKININDEISLDIYIPKSENKTATFPTLYVMDGQHYMYNAIGYQKSLTRGISSVNVSPEFIVVGINTENLAKNKLRANYFNEHSAKLLSLLSNDIIPYVQKNYPASKRRLYFGWQSAAIFGLKLFNHNPMLFEGYLLASAQYLSPGLLAKTEEVFKNNKLSNDFYLTIGAQEQHTFGGHNALTRLFERYKSTGLNWQYQKLDRFSGLYDHHTSPLEVLTEGLAWHFSDYPDVSFGSVDEINDFGGVSGTVQYYKKRAQRYGVSSEIGSQTRFSMFRQAVKAKDYTLFKRFERELGEYVVTGWYGYFGQFFIENNALDRARKVYLDAIKERGDDSRHWAGLGDVYVKGKLIEEALDCYRKALKYASSQRIERYQKKIDALINIKNNE